MRYGRPGLVLTLFTIVNISQRRFIFKGQVLDTQSLVYKTAYFHHCCYSAKKTEITEQEKNFCSQVVTMELAFKNLILKYDTDIKKIFHIFIYILILENFQVLEKNIQYHY